MRTIEEYLDIVSTLKTYLDQLHNIDKNSKEDLVDDNTVIMISPDGKNMQLGTKITK